MSLTASMEPLIVALVAVAALVILMFVMLHLGARTWRSLAPDARERFRRRRDVRRGIREIEAFLADAGSERWSDEHAGPFDGRQGSED
jgi:hypothetical protein